MNFEEQKKRIIDSGYKHVSLYRGNDRICAWNLAGRIDAKLEEIKTRLQNNPPGVYLIKCRNSTSEKNPDVFEVNTGSEKMPEQKTHIVYKEPASDKLLENQQILNLTVQLKQLEMENKYLLQQVADLENEIAEMETAAAVNLAEQTPVPNLMESAKEFLGGLMEFGAPLLDQHFALKKQQLEIERMKLANRRPAPGSKLTVKDSNVQIRIIGEFVETFKDQPEIYEALHNISSQSDSVEKYMELLNQFSPDLYEQLSVKI
jgi:hypothetical protein